MRHELYISRDFTGDFSLDSTISDLVKPLGAEHMGSGAGCGTRDLDFLLPKPMTGDEVQALHQSLVAACPGIDIDVLYEEWPDDTNYEGGPLVAYFS
ncbi:hypothetical protein [Mesorhizobium sp.]|uniref:hypothetical protein n=1 Tax=Mesorhizobium sp. TaxID=1871066 RepID=UPI000FE466BF|nr:hypothetical protein [Mesorhizobium sp.]RWI35546.1 MAG: hypothetical protein EOR14_29015 [Mesorhizobium sp.]RWJ66447.1 MAG: hypothetical protein EOR34_28955 [Mesorhizobium sp.]